MSNENRPFPRIVKNRWYERPHRLWRRALTRRVNRINEIADAKRWREHCGGDLLTTIRKLQDVSSSESEATLGNYLAEHGTLRGYSIRVNDNYAVEPIEFVVSGHGVVPVPE